MNKHLILVIEDDVAVSNLITTTLETHDYRFNAAPNGESAILEAVTHKPDVILMDLGLPDIDGIDLIKKYVHGPTFQLLLSVPEVRIQIRLMPLMQVQMIILQNPFQSKSCWHDFVLPCVA